MHTIDILEEALLLASLTGWQVRQESLNGARGGACRIGNIRFLFVDCSLTAEEQLDQVLQALREQLRRSPETDPFTAHFVACLNASPISNELRRCLMQQTFLYPSGNESNQPYCSSKTGASC